MTDYSINEKLVPGKTIEYIEGEILSIKLSQWGVIGQLRTDFGTYDYKLKEPEMAKRILVGMNLAISNGFCVKSKSNEIIVTDGKFGKTSIGIQLESYYSMWNNKFKLLTGKVKRVIRVEENLIVEIETYYPPDTCKEVSIPLQENEGNITFAKRLEESANRIIRIELEKNQANSVCSVEILPEDHFWYKFEELKGGNLENATYFSQLMMKQKDVIESYVRTFTELLFNLGGDLSKTTLTSINNLLNFKIYGGELRFPFNLLISESNIEHYLNKMVEFSRSFIYGSSIVQKPDDLLVLINNFFPAYE
ncbi:MAG: hypothetical protein KGD64_07090 [Candidatus Heimdallarchaeota archaeon]|nr:hypothetical protein [Candidatus Heimdallarchaeota archaeon]